MAAHLEFDDVIDPADTRRWPRARAGRHARAVAKARAASAPSWMPGEEAG
ncbi:MAG: hypothetical protein QM749_09825 [Aquabacterium sp.]